MTPRPPTVVAASLARGLVTWLDHAGHDVTSLLHEAGLRVDPRQAPRSFVPSEAVNALYRLTATRLRDPWVGVRAAGMDPERWGLAGFVLAQHPRLGDGLHRGLQVFTGLHPDFTLVDATTPRGRALGFRSPDPHLGSEMLTRLVQRTRALLPGAWAPVGVQLQLEADAVDAQARARLHAHPDLGADADVVVVSHHDLDRPVPDADPVLLAHLEEAFATQVAKRRLATDADQVLQLGDTVIDLARRQVVRQGEARRLTPLEAGVLAYFVARPNTLITAVELEREVWGVDADTLTQAPAVAVRRLRRKLEADPGHPRHLVTVFGEGWRLEIPAGKRETA